MEHARYNRRQGMYAGNGYPYYISGNTYLHQPMRGITHMYPQAGYRNYPNYPGFPPIIVHPPYVTGGRGTIESRHRRESNEGQSGIPEFDKP